MSDNFRAMIIEERDGKPFSSFRELTLEQLPDHPVLVEVKYSTLNYKDALSISGKGRIARRFPMVVGADLAGTVVESSDPAWSVGESVVVNGWGLSETEWGGYSRYQRLKPEWLTRPPEKFSLEETMAIGTAGYTAALAVLALEAWGTIKESDREVLVTGAAGGVGSVSIALLAARGYNVIASTGRPETHTYLKELGAAGLVDRASMAEGSGALQKERWAGAIDSVGSSTLANIIAQTAYGGAVAACGIAGGADLPTTVMPYILRGVALLGIDSVRAAHVKRDRAWSLLDESLDRNLLASMTRVEPMTKLAELAATMMDGQIRGRTVIDVSR